MEKFVDRCFRISQRSKNKNYFFAAMLLNGSGKVVATSTNGISATCHAETELMKQWLFKEDSPQEEVRLQDLGPEVSQRWNASRFKALSFVL
jgi:hypothetical protein